MYGYGYGAGQVGNAQTNQVQAITIYDKLNNAYSVSIDIYRQLVMDRCVDNNNVVICDNLKIGDILINRTDISPQRYNNQQLYPAMNNGSYYHGGMSNNRTISDSMLGNINNNIINTNTGGIESDYIPKSKSTIKEIMNETPIIEQVKEEPKNVSSDTNSPVYLLKLDGYHPSEGVGFIPFYDFKNQYVEVDLFEDKKKYSIKIINKG